MLATTIIAAGLILAPLSGMAQAGNKGDGNFCPGRNNTCGSSGGGGGGGGGTGNTVDNCDNKVDGQYLLGLTLLVTCNNFDVIDSITISL